MSDTLKIWADFLKKRWFLYVLGILTVVLTNICQVLTTRIYGWLIDFFSGNKIPAFFNNKFLTIFIWLLVTRVFLTIGRYGWRITLGRQTHYSAAFLRKKIWEHVLYFKFGDLEKIFSKGILMNTSNSDVGSARLIFGMTIIAITDLLFLIIFCLWAMISINGLLTASILAIMLILPVIMKRLNAKEMKNYEVAQEALSSFDDLVVQSVSSIRLQKITQTGGIWSKRLTSSADEFRLKRLKASFISLLYIPVMGGASLFSYMVLFVLGIGFTIRGQISVGDFVAMQGLVVLLQEPMGEFGFIISEWRKGLTSLKRLNGIYSHLQDSSLISSGSNVFKNELLLEVKNLSFSHEKDKYIIKDLNLNLKRGERLGIRGPIGSGKSTLIKLLCGFERSHEGEIKFYGKSFSNYPHSELRKGITVVPQKPFLFSGPLRQNISMDRNLSDQEIWHYLEMADLKEDVERFKAGLETDLGEWGINLSGGQKQRLTLARALARRPDFLLLDDCLSAVDTVTEEKILKNIDKELADTTLIWVAHRASTLKYCHKTIEL
jgi:ATP-binding cassette, subfamily B, multidrug efflux pump